MVREDIYQELYLAITELPEDCREIFWLYFQGRNNKEIAEILSKGINKKLHVQTDDRVEKDNIKEHLGEFDYGKWRKAV